MNIAFFSNKLVYLYNSGFFSFFQELWTFRKVAPGKIIFYLNLPLKKATVWKFMA